MHHTGKLWIALDNVAGLVKRGGYLWIAIYNDQGERSVVWKAVKQFYNTGAVGKWLVPGLGVPLLVGRAFAVDLLRLRNPFKRYWKQGDRGMVASTDLIDWLGGWPF